MFVSELIILALVGRNAGYDQAYHVAQYIRYACTYAITDGT